LIRQPTCQPDGHRRQTIGNVNLHINIDGFYATKGDGVYSGVHAPLGSMKLWRHDAGRILPLQVY